MTTLMLILVQRIRMCIHFHSDVQTDVQMNIPQLYSSCTTGDNNRNSTYTEIDEWKINYYSEKNLPGGRFKFLNSVDFFLGGGVVSVERMTVSPNFFSRSTVFFFSGVGVTSPQIKNAFRFYYGLVDQNKVDNPYTKVTGCVCVCTEGSR